jgi:hypothetical protein
MIPFSPGPALRAAGPAVAAALPAGMPGRWPARLAVVLATDVAARRFGRPGITIIGITPGDGKQFPPAKQLAADAVGTAGWVGATALLTAAADRLRVPQAVTAVLLGAAVYAGDLKGRAFAERARAAAEQARAAADQARARLDDTPEAQPAP